MRTIEVVREFFWILAGVIWSAVGVRMWLVMRSDARKEKAVDARLKALMGDPAPKRPPSEKH
jgi:hypothetical protein